MHRLDTSPVATPPRKEGTESGKNDSPTTSVRKYRQTQSDEAVLAEARALFENWLDFPVRGADDAVEFVHKLADGEFLRRIADSIAQKKNPSFVPRLVPVGHGSSQENLSMFASVCRDELGFEQNVILTHSDLYVRKNVHKAAVCFSRLKEAFYSHCDFPATPRPARSRSVFQANAFTCRTAPLPVRHRGSVDERMLDTRGHGDSDSQGTPSRLSSALSAVSSLFSFSKRMEGTPVKAPATASKLETLQAERDRLQAELQRSATKVREVETEAALWREQFEGKTKTLQETESVMHNLRSQFERVRESNNELQSTVAKFNGSKDEELAKLQESLQRAQEELDTARREAAEAKEAHQHAEKTKETLQEEIQAVQQKLASTAEELDCVIHELQRQGEEHRQREEASAKAYAKLQSDTAATAAVARSTLQRCKLAHSALQEAGTVCTTLSSKVREEFHAAGVEFSRFRHQLVHAVRTIQTDASVANQRFVRENRERRRVFNLLQDVRGNIRVFCRVRPRLAHEIEAGDGSVVRCISEHEVAMSSLGVTQDHSDSSAGAGGGASGGTSSSASGVPGTPNRSGNRPPKSFEFDRVFGEDSNQTDVYDEISPMVMSALDGYHCCIFAYGQTGSGKTHTMQGTPDEPGVYFRTLRQLFEECQDRSDSHTFEVHVSVVEIYNEHVRDLLAEVPSGSSGRAARSVDQAPDLEIKQGQHGVFLPSAERVQVHGVRDVEQVMSRGERNRSVGATDANAHSSRSHMLLMIDILGVNSVTQAESRGRLVLVDLAGSERVSKSGASGQRMKEAQNINRSLSALGDVIGALTHKKGHVPFRNSKLTYLLQDSLGKDNKALMIVQVSPTESSQGETTCSLNFASRVRKVEQGKARAHGDTAETQRLKKAVRDAREEARQAQAQVEQLRSTVDATTQAKQAAEARLSDMEKKVASVTAEARRGSAAQDTLDSLREEAAEARGQVQQRDQELAQLRREIVELQKGQSTAAKEKQRRQSVAQASAVEEAVAKERALREEAVAAAVKETEKRMLAQQRSAVCEAETRARAAAAAESGKADSDASESVSSRLPRAAKKQRKRSQESQAGSRSRSRTSSVSSSGSTSTGVPRTGGKGLTSTTRRRMMAKNRAVTQAQGRRVSTRGRPAGAGGVGPGRTTGRRRGSSASSASDDPAPCASDMAESKPNGAAAAPTPRSTMSCGDDEQKQTAKAETGGVAHADAPETAVRSESASVTRKRQRLEESDGSTPQLPPRPPSAAPASGDAKKAVGDPEPCASEPPAPTTSDGEEGDCQPSPPKKARTTNDADGDECAQDDAGPVIVGSALNKFPTHVGAPEARVAMDDEGEGDDEGEEEEEEDDVVVFNFGGGGLNDTLTLARERDNDDFGKENNGQGEESLLGDLADGQVVEHDGGHEEVGEENRGNNASYPKMDQAADADASVQEEEEEEEDQGASDDEFQSPSRVFGEAAVAGESEERHARWASDLARGTPKTRHAAPSYKLRHETGKSPAVAGILKSRRRVTNDSSGTEERNRPASPTVDETDGLSSSSRGRRTGAPGHTPAPSKQQRRITPAGETPSNVTDATTRAVTTASGHQVRRSSRLERETAAETDTSATLVAVGQQQGAPKGTPAPRSTQAILGSILKSSSRASFLLNSGSGSSGSGAGAKRSVGGAARVRAPKETGRSNFNSGASRVSIIEASATGRAAARADQLQKRGRWR